MAVNLAIGCGQCRWCLRGYRMLCKDWKCVGFDVDGGDAEYLVVPVANCMPIPDVDEFRSRGHLDRHGGHAIQHAEAPRVSGVDTVAMSGIGPMGAAGILVAKARGARVIAIDVLDSRLEMARELGADELVDAREGETAERLKD